MNLDDFVLELDPRLQTRRIALDCRFISYCQTILFGMVMVVHDEILYDRP